MAESKPKPIFPVTFPIPPDKLSDEKLDLILKQDLPEWEVKKSLLPENPEITRAELFREFRFADFKEVIEYMNKVAICCEILPHHPRWENIWTTLRVYLTTWDAIHIISYKDVMLARYMDKIYAEYATPPTNTRQTVRTLDETEAFKKQLIIYVEDDDLEKTFESLNSYKALNFSGRYSEDDFSLLKNMYNKFQKENRLGLLSGDDQRMAHARIVRFLLDFIKTI